jgi:pimeloyl-ACP methyl ester carboxylesterase
MNPSEFQKRYPGLDSPPPLHYLLGELKLPLVLGKTAGQWLFLPRYRSGKGQTVLLLPGYGAHVKAMGLVKRYLTRLDYQVHDWSLGTNNGDMKGSLPLVQADIDRIVQQTGKPVSLIGWSLGGTMARECAREEPASIRQIITLGSPVVGGPRFTAFKPLFERRGFDLDRAANTVLSRYRKPLNTAVTALYCKRDSIVHWQACIDRFSENVDHVEIKTPHMSMPFSAEVMGLLHDRLTP